MVKIIRRLDGIARVRRWPRDIYDPDTWFGLARRSSLTDLEDLHFGGVDHCLITAFIERWHPETNTFHMPWGEMGIALHDVHVIMGLAIDGDALLTVRDDTARHECLVHGIICFCCW